MGAFLSGKKTYLLAGGGAVVTMAWLLGWVDRDTYEAVMAFLGFGGLATLRAGVAKS